MAAPMGLTQARAGADPVRLPSYPVAAIDNTLRTLQLLNSAGEVRVVDVANYLDVARSTAHRILTMLTYHGFAEQNEARRYRLRTQPAAAASHANDALVSCAHPVLVKLAAVTGHTAHLVVLEGNGARFLHGVVPRGTTGLGDREGVLYPAHLTAGGRALLADLSELDLRRLFPSRIGGLGVPAIDHRVISGVLEGVRRRGYAVNEGQNESGVNAVGVGVHGCGGATIAALVVAGRTQRMARSSFAAMAAVLAVAVRSVESAF